MKHDNNHLTKRLSVVLLMIFFIQFLITGCSDNFVADTGYNLDEELNIPKVVFVFDDSEMSKDAKPVMSELRNKYQEQAKFYFIDSKTDEARPVVEKYGLTKSDDYPYIAIEDASGMSSRSIHGFNSITRQSIEDYILQAVRDSTIPEGFDGQWEVVSTQPKGDGLNSTAYGIIINSGDKIQFIDGRIVQFGAFRMKYELTGDNEIHMVIDSTNSMVFTYEISENTLILENNFVIVKANKE